MQQVVKRLAEIEKFHDAPSLSEKVGKGRFSKQHDSGPLINRRTVCKQYQEMQLGIWFLSSKAPDNCLFMNDLTVVCIKNIIRCLNGDFIVGRRFQRKNELFSYPLPSPTYEIVLVGVTSRRK